MLKNIIEIASFLYVGILVILSIPELFRQHHVKKSCSYKVKAKLVGIKKDYYSSFFGGSSRGPDLYPIFEYTYDGKLYKGTSKNIFLSSKAYKIGEIHTIYINPKKPRVCCLKGFKNRIGK